MNIAARAEPPRRSRYLMIRRATIQIVCFVRKPIDEQAPVRILYREDEPFCAEFIFFCDYCAPAIGTSTERTLWVSPVFDFGSFHVSQSIDLSI